MELHRLSKHRLTVLVAAIMVVAGATAGFGEDDMSAVQPARTESPRETLRSFQALSDDLVKTLQDYRTNRTWGVRDRLAQIGDEVVSLLDLSAVPESSRREQGVRTATYLLDIIGRVGLPDPSQIPDATAFKTDTAVPAQWRIPNTPLEIARVREGPRAGEFLFSPRTVTVAPRFYSEIRSRPLKSSLPIKSWSRALPQLTGPLIPAAFVDAVPDGLTISWLDTPLWKILATLALGAVAFWLLAMGGYAVKRRKPRDGLAGSLGTLLIAIVVIVVLRLLWMFVVFELNVAGAFAVMFDNAVTVLSSLASVWVLWSVVQIGAEVVIRSPRIPDTSLDASLIRLTARLFGIAGGTIVLAYAGNALGLPVFSIIAGLGIGGLAVALAVRPTLENLIGGLILYADRPVRVGDYCMFNSHIGTVERIGVRSTQIRGLDRTIISVPNAKFADMEIINWAQCDQMMIETGIGLRYETEPDQLRHVLARLREMFYAHPKIDPETVRVRFVGYGDSSLDIAIRVYALTREWNEFYAIQEDVLLRVADIVQASGSGFAFPSQTVYVRRDEGLDEDRANTATDEVKSWRRTGKLPFPMPSAAKVDELAGTLDYPPRGSPDSLSPEAIETEAPERLSADADADESQDAKPAP